MEIKNLMTFKTILETGSFQGAARQLNYAQSTVTTQIQQLEQELNVKLFDKIGRKMVLSQAGNDVLILANQLLETYEAMKNYANHTQLNGELRIAIPESLLTYKMQSILKEFHENAPDVKIYLKTLNCFSIPDEVENGSSDLGIYYDVSLNRQQIIEKKIWSHDISIIGSQNDENKEISFITKNKTYDTCILSNDSQSIYQKYFEEMISDKNIQFSHRIEAGSIESIKRSVISGLGIAIFPTFVFEEELKKNLVQKIPSELDNKKIETVYSYHKNKWLSPSLSYFIELLNNATN